MANFQMGSLLATCRVDELMKNSTDFLQFVLQSLRQYEHCDWGTLTQEDKSQNDYAVRNGERIMAQYDAPDQPRIWIITEWDRSVTTILFPDEY